MGDSFGLHPSLIDTVSVSAIYRSLNLTSKHERSPAFPHLLSLFLSLYLVSATIINWLDNPPASFNKVRQDEISDDDDEGQVPYVCSPLCKLVGESERERETKKAFSREEERNYRPLHSSSSLFSAAAIADLAVYNITQVSQCKERAPLPHIIVDVCIQAQLVYMYLPHLT